jgi:hypothetical protein
MRDDRSSRATVAYVPVGVRLVERARRRLFGTRSTASFVSPHGGAEVVLKRFQWVFVASLVSLLAVACGGGKNEGAAVATSTTSVRTTTTTAHNSSTSLDERAAVAGASEAASRAFIEAAAIPDPDAAAVPATHTGPMLDQRRTTLLGLKAEGKAIRYPTPSQYRIEIEDTQLDGDVARLTVCVVDDGQRVDADSTQAPSGGVGTVRWRAAMRKVDDTWRLAERVESERWDGVYGCASE